MGCYDTGSDKKTVISVSGLLFKNDLGIGMLLVMFRSDIGSHKK